MLDSITDSVDMNLSKLKDSGGPGSLLCYIVHGVAKSGIQLSDWRTTIEIRTI